MAPALTFRVTVLADFFETLSQSLLTFFIHHFLLACIVLSIRLLYFAFII
jgi:hypothetical protein